MSGFLLVGVDDVDASPEVRCEAVSRGSEEGSSGAARSRWESPRPVAFVLKMEEHIPAGRKRIASIIRRGTTEVLVSNICVKFVLEAARQMLPSRHGG